MSKFKLSFIFNIFLFIFIFFSYFFIAPTYKQSFATCSPIGAQRCSGSGFQQCNGTTWVSYSCPAGYFCKVVGTNNVSCVEGCTQRGYSCLSACGVGQTSQPYFCASGTCCSGVANNSSGTCTQTPGQYCAPTATGCGTNPQGSGTCLDPTTQQPNGICCLTSGGSGSGNPPPPTTNSTALCYTCPDSGPQGQVVAYDQTNNNCYYIDNNQQRQTTIPPTTGSSTCSSGQLCTQGCGCSSGDNFAGACSLKPGIPVQSPACSNGLCKTAIGEFSITNVSDLISSFFSVILSISGIIAVFLILMSGYRLVSSQGEPEKLQLAREQLTAAVIGLLFVILSTIILEYIGVNVLNLPGFT